MYERLSELLLHVIVPLFVIAILISRVVIQHRAHKRAARDASRLALGLRIELGVLREIYQENLDLITRDASYLLSTRAATGFYKANLGRLTFLFPEPALVATVTFYTLNEKIEAHLAAACTRPNGGFAYQVEPANPQLQDLKGKYIRGCDGIDTAISLLGALRGDDGPSVATRSRGFIRPIATFLGSRE